MKILCVVSENPGHIDFGGMGYVNLARALITQGHQVEWVSLDAQVERLRQHKFNVHNKPSATALKLKLFVDANEHQYKQRIHELKSFAADLAQLAPDIILFDRALAYGPMVAEHLGVPYACVGTPGGYWEYGGSFLQPVAEPVRAYHELGERIRLDLQWRGAPPASHWAHSPTLNICFTGINFYGATQGGANTAYVDNFNNSVIPENGDRVGISYGNTGAPPLLDFLIQCTMDNKLISEPIDVFVGNNEDIYVDLNETFPDRNLHTHMWVDFAKYFARLKYLVFFGGIGTVWQCVNHYQPMLILPGLVGDQWINAESVSRLGIGARLLLTKPNCALVASAIEDMQQKSSYVENIIAYRSRNNFTDNIDSLCERVTRLAV